MLKRQEAEACIAGMVSENGLSSSFQSGVIFIGLKVDAGVRHGQEEEPNSPVDTILGCLDAPS